MRQRAGDRGPGTARWAWLGVIVASACGTTQADLGGSGDPGTPGDGGIADVPALPTVMRTNKLDLLLVVDNSLSMSPQQRNLVKAIPDFVERLVGENPGFSDVHVGLITTTLGSRPGDACSTVQPGSEAAKDDATLIGSRPRFEEAALRHPSAAPLAPEGYAPWTPDESVLSLGESVAAMVEAAGWQGCEFQSPLEAMYRFLSDPEPPLEFVTEQCSASNSNPCSRKAGINDELLAQRRAFLRPDSAVAIALFTDENDCSLGDRGQGYYAARRDIEMPASAAACAVNPNDKCCVSCISPLPAECEPDPGCAVHPTLEPEADGFSLRCFAQKRRFGIDFMYPVSRYTTALTESELCISRDDLLPDEDRCLRLDDESSIRENPLFAASDGFRRDPSMVYVLGVVGVPHADLVGEDGAYRSPSGLDDADTWSVILGNPAPPDGAAPVSPSNVLMIESLSPRGGNDGQGVSLALPSAGPLANPQNGHEHQHPDRLQAACLVPLASPIDCTVNAALPAPRPECNCEGDPAGSGLAECQDPSSGVYGNVQLYDEVYPTPRQLELLKSLGESGVTASLCAPQFTDPSRDDYGYRDAALALSRQMRRSTR